MINQALIPTIKEHIPLGCHLMAGGSLKDYSEIMGRIFSLVERASHRVPRIDEPYLWVFVHYYLFGMKLLPTVAQIQMGYARVDKKELYILKEALNVLEENFVEKAQMCVKAVKSFPVSGLYFSVIVNSMVAAAEARLRDNGVTPDMESYQDLKDSYWNWTLKNSIYDVETAMMSWAVDIGSLNPIRGRKAEIAIAAIDRMVKTIDRLKDPEPICFISASDNLTNNLKQLLNYIAQSNNDTKK